VSVRKICFIIQACLFFSLITQAQESASLGAVSGVVINKLTEAPLKNAHVIYTKIDPVAASSLPLSKETDAEGRFSLQLPPGSYRLWIERNGYARQVYGALSPAGEGTTLTLARGQQLGPITFRVAPLGAIAGRVMDEDGEPVQSAGIQVLRFSYANGHRELISVAGTTSNDRGEYRVFGLRAGRYLLQVSMPNAPMSRLPESGALIPEVQDAYAPSYYPGVADVDSASLVSLGEGSELSDINFQLHKVRALGVHGRLASPVERFSSSQIQVVLAHNEGGVASHIGRISGSIDGSTGKFEVRGASPGSYFLVASQLFAGHALGGRVPLEVSATARQDVTVPLVSALEVTGTLELEGVPRGSVPNLVARLTASEGLALGPQPVSKVGSDGSIHFSGVTPGHWTLSFDSLPEGLWIKSETFAGNEAPAGEFNFTENTRGQLHVVLAGNGGQISGTVSLDSQPSRATVVLVPSAPELRDAHQMYRVTNTTERGLFTLKGVRPGSYKLFAFQEIEPFEWFDPEQLKQVEEMGSSIDVSEGANVLRDIVAVPPDALLPH
jgi:hypothetical protein